MMLNVEERTRERAEPNSPFAKGISAGGQRQPISGSLSVFQNHRGPSMRPRTQNNSRDRDARLSSGCLSPSPEPHLTSQPTATPTPPPRLPSRRRPAALPSRRRPPPAPSCRCYLPAVSRLRTACSRSAVPPAAPQTRTQARTPPQTRPAHALLALAAHRLPASALTCRRQFTPSLAGLRIAPRLARSPAHACVARVEAQQDMS